MTAAAEIIRIRTYEDLLAWTLTALGFRPAQSVVMTALADQGPFQVRVDLPDSCAEDACAAVGDELIRAAMANHARQIGLLYYLDPLDRSVAQVYDQLIGAGFARVGLPGFCSLAVGAGEYLDLTQPGTAPVTFDLGAHPLVARAVFDGQVTFSSRAGVVASLAPVDDLMRRRMRKLTVDATEQFGVDLDSLRSGQGRSQPLRVGEVQLGRHVDSLMCAAIDSGQPMTDVDAATTLLGLQAPKIRALVRHRICRVNAASYVTVLSDLTRRSPRTMTAPVAGLLAFAAWLSGNGALAWVAIDRTRQDDPAEPLAACVAEFLTGALAPRHYRDRSDPELYREFYPER